MSDEGNVIDDVMAYDERKRIIMNHDDGHACDNVGSADICARSASPAICRLKCAQGFINA